MARHKKIPATKKIIGITGGIGSGKSAVAAEFVRLGCGLVDADRIARALLEKPVIKSQIRLAFGDGAFAPDGSVDRNALAEKAFSSSSCLEKLNNIIHPRVLLEARKLITRYNRKPDIPAIVMDMPLLLEVGWGKNCDVIIFVDCQAQIRRQRLKKTAAFPENQLKKRENFQISLDKKAKNAHYIINNNSGLSAMAEQVVRIFSTIIE